MRQLNFSLNRYAGLLSWLDEHNWGDPVRITSSLRYTGDDELEPAELEIRASIPASDLPALEENVRQLDPFAFIDFSSGSLISNGVQVRTFAQVTITFEPRVWRIPEPKEDEDAGE